MNDSASGSSLLNRTLVLLFGVVSYLIGVAGLVCLILAFAGLVPFGFFGVQVSSLPLIWDLALVGLWGLIHSAMARQGFKDLLTKLIPEPAERPTYVLIAGITSIVLVGHWQTLPGIVWSVENSTAAVALWALFGFGWVYLLASTFAINHFDLFGLRQVYLHFRDQKRPPLNFVKRAMYRFTRHPIQTGVLIGIWATPEMSVTHLILSMGFTAYIFIGLWFEERDLIEEFGESYASYRQEAGMLLPKFSTRK